ncbi:MAG: BON domain-containing protein [Cytophagaceae bacterium]|nr:MAG: BON domain-containing protein [Cytophagaceae bacterium]
MNTHTIILRLHIKIELAAAAEPRQSSSNRWVMTVAMRQARLQCLREDPDRSCHPQKHGYRSAQASAPWNEHNFTPYCSSGIHVRREDMFLSTLQPTASFAFAHDHGMAIEKTAIETEISYLSNFDGHNLTVEVVDDFIVLEGVVTSSGDHARVMRIAREIVGYDRVLSRVFVNIPQ